eukprot:TRINITY_DN215_c2_g1_i1.p1 TRINITY_DN215_c2_g1~~TRINITY_DN215_c2_g1_i1.p1  ORF type:complete len:664 (+),score=124.47 TRINITY_DN215_c2_g1_i1:150-2141(+)
MGGSQSAPSGGGAKSAAPGAAPPAQQQQQQQQSMPRSAAVGSPPPKRASPRPVRSPQPPRALGPSVSTLPGGFEPDDSSSSGSGSSGRGSPPGAAPSPGAEQRGNPLIVAQALSAAAAADLESKRVAKAMASLARCVRLRTEALGATHPVVASTQRQLAGALAEAGCRAEALAVLRRAEIALAAHAARGFQLPPPADEAAVQAAPSTFHVVTPAASRLLYLAVCEEGAAAACQLAAECERMGSDAAPSELRGQAAQLLQRRAALISAAPTGELPHPQWQMYAISVGRAASLQEKRGQAEAAAELWREIAHTDEMADRLSGDQPSRMVTYQGRFAARQAGQLPGWWRSVQGARSPPGSPAPAASAAEQVEYEARALCADARARLRRLRKSRGRRKRSAAATLGGSPTKAHWESLPGANPSDSPQPRSRTPAGASSAASGEGSGGECSTGADAADGAEWLPCTAAPDTRQPQPDAGESSRSSSTQSASGTPADQPKDWSGSVAAPPLFPLQRAALPAPDTPAVAEAPTPPQAALPLRLPAAAPPPPPAQQVPPREAQSSISGSDDAPEASPAAAPSEPEPCRGAAEASRRGSQSSCGGASTADTTSGAARRVSGSDAAAPAVTSAAERELRVLLADIVGDDPVAKEIMMLVGGSPRGAPAHPPAG